MHQKWHTTINWMSDQDIAKVLEKYRLLGDREVLRTSVMNKAIPKSELEPYIPHDKAYTWQGPSL